MYLNCHTYYSLRYGTIDVSTLLDLGQKNESSFIALTDINNTSACLDFIRQAKNVNIKPLVGVDIRNGISQQYVLLARSNKGFENINRFISERLHAKKDFESQPTEMKDIFTIYPYNKVVAHNITHFKKHEYIGISLKDLSKLPFSTYRKLQDIMVIQQPVSFRNQTDYNAHRLLRAIDLNILLSQLPKDEQGTIEERMIQTGDLLTQFENYPIIIENTRRLAKACNVLFSFDEQSENQNQQFFFSSIDEDFEFLKRECYKKLSDRFQHTSPELLNRLNRELGVIKDKRFVSYFLINYHYIKYAKEMNFPHIGRGSGVNSLVAYVLGITNVDPLELGLYFERFINEFRDSPPDFDIDFSWSDREEITKFIFREFKNVALMGTYVTFQYKAVVRELGKVFGLPKEEIDSYLHGTQRSSNNDNYFQLILKYGKLIQGFPNYLSVHAGGILITEKPIYHFSATFMPPKGYQTVQFDMNIAESVGIHKYDVLSQTGLPKIKDTIEIVKKNQPNAQVEDIDNYKRFTADSNINELLKVGNCIGVFYVESPAMRVLMTKLRTDNYLGLVAASSIIRPGVSNGGMKNEYILRHRDPSRCKEAHPIMMKILKDTYGVMVYQEDVLKVAHEFAGLTLAEADILRRGMRGKVRSREEFTRIEKKFRTNCLERGYPTKLTEEVWSQIRAFAGYAFAKGHSASYAVESYQSLYLKRYFPLEFMTAVLNNGGGYYNIPTYINEIRKCGGIVEPPCLNNSGAHNILKGKTVFLGFSMVKSLEKTTIETIITERDSNGNFVSLNDLIDRTYIGLEQLMLIIRLGGFRFTGLNKHEIAWQAHLRIQKIKSQSTQPPLFKADQKEFNLPIIPTNAISDAYDEIELLGYPLISYFELLADSMQSDLMAKDIPQFVNCRIVIFGNLVTAKGTPTNDKRLMHFGTFLDKKGDFFDTVHFPDISEKYPIVSKGIYKITGKVVEELDYFCIIAEKVEHQALVTDPRSQDIHSSRDSHFNRLTKEDTSN